MAKHKLKALIIGAGGVTSYMLPALKNSFDLEVAIFDGDILETKNLDRQLFRNNMVGQYKAKALLKQYNFRAKEGTAICQYFDEEIMDTEYKYWAHWADVIICNVDNHPARLATIKVAQELRTPLIICANEYSTSQVMFYDPVIAEFDHPAMHPLNRYPEIETIKTGSPIACQGDALESTPQLAIANQVSASLGNYLLYQWAEYILDEGERFDWLPVEYQTTFSKIETTTLADLPVISNA
jgi:molybdopterin/thiamine biosynthesis adenylyltransferase